jgi:hypothetical protein
MTLAAAAMALAAFAVTAPAAMAHGEDTVEFAPGGKVTLSLNGKTKKALKNAGITVSGKSFSITDGDINPIDASTGELTLKGKITFKGNHHKAVFKALELILAGKDKLTGKLKGKTVTIANLKGGTVSRQGLESTDVTGINGTLTKGAAKAVNKVLESKAVKKGAKLGKANIDTRLAEALIAATGQTTVEYSADFLQKLSDAGVSYSTTAPATDTTGPNGRPQPSFPITGGKANPTTLFGKISHTGGVVFAEGASQLPLAELAVENSPSKAELTVAFGGARAAAADLDLSGMTRTTTAGGVDLGNVVVKLNSAAAALLNATFNPSGTTTFAAGDVLGTAASSVTFK